MPKPSNTVDDRIRRLSEWYEAQCDGDWEHDFGITIESLDNPGWRLKIDLEGTALADAAFDEVSDLEPEREWIRCWVADKAFHGAGGPGKLTALLDIFLEWATTGGRHAGGGLR